MTGSIGQQLRAAREARGISLREISEQTRISTRYLEAIEQNNYKNLPGGIFNKSFVKAYAKYVGIDEKDALAGYAQTSRESGENPDEVQLTPHHTSEPFASTRSPLVTLLLTVLILGILSLVAYGVLHWYQRTESAGNQPAPSQPAPTATLAAAPTPAPTQGTRAPDGSMAIQVKAPAEDVWLRATIDEEKPSEIVIKAGMSQDYSAKQKFKIVTAKVKANSLEITIDGRAVKITPDTSGKMAEFVIDKSNLPQAL
jgi:cytoskeletal protein RodZ